MNVAYVCRSIFHSKLQWQ